MSRLNCLESSYPSSVVTVRYEPLFPGKYRKLRGFFLGGDWSVEEESDGLRIDHPALNVTSFLNRDSYLVQSNDLDRNLQRQGIIAALELLMIGVSNISVRETSLRVDARLGYAGEASPLVLLSRVIEGSRWRTFQGSWRVVPPPPAVGTSIVRESSGDGTKVEVRPVNHGRSAVDIGVSIRRRGRLDSEYQFRKLWDLAGSAARFEERNIRDILFNTGRS